MQTVFAPILFSGSIELRAFTAEEDVNMEEEEKKDTNKVV